MGSLPNIPGTLMGYQRYIHGIWMGYMMGYTVYGVGYTMGLVGGLEHFLFSDILGIVIDID